MTNRTTGRDSATGAAALAQATPPSALSRLFGGETPIALLFILPSLIGFAVFYAVPAVRGLILSFTNWDMLSTPSFVGLSNYQQILADSDFWHALLVTVLYVVLNIPLQTVLALAVAVMMDRVAKNIFVRSVFIIPWLLPPVIAALLWLWMLDPLLGIVNQFLGLFGISRLGFLGDPTLAMPSIAAINIWQYTGYTALLLFAGLQSIPKQVYEAASIDGAGEWRMFRSVTLPLLRPVLVFVLVTTVVGSFQIFDTIAVTSKGGPVNATRVILWYIYDFAFSRFRMGYATAVSVILFLILIAVTIAQMRILQSDSSDLA